MADQVTLDVASRPNAGSHDARRQRRIGRIPGVLYGHGDAQPVSLDAADFRGKVSPAHYGAQVVMITLDGKNAGNALVKGVQVNTLNRQILSIDLQRVRKEDRISVSVPIVLQGEPTGARAGGVMDQVMYSVNLRCGATSVPTEITLDVSPLEIGDLVHAAQLAIPADCELLDKPDDVVVVIAAPTLPALEEPVVVEEGETGPELTGEGQQEERAE